MKLLTKLLIKAYGAPAAPLTFGVNVYGMTGALPASGNAIVTINPVAPVNAITPVITVSRSTGVAPLAVTFDALGTSAPAYTSLPFSEIYYAWTFGDPAGGATWAYGTRPGVNLKNEANGPVAAHVFETDGSYTVTCWAFYLDSGGTLRSGSATTSITVTNANTVFSGTNTICISQNSLPVQGVNGVPADAAVQQVPNWSTVQTLASTYKRILLKRGDTWVTTSGGVEINVAGAGIIGAYGTGAKPVISMDSDFTLLRFSSNADDWRVMDIVFTSPHVTYYQFANAVLSAGDDTLALRCEMSYMGRVTFGGDIGGHGLYLVDSVIGPAWTTGGNLSINVYTGLKDRVALLGNNLLLSNEHGARLQGTALSVISNNNISTARSSSHGLTIREKANDADLPTWSGLWTENVVVSDNYIYAPNGSITLVTIKPQNSNSAGRLRNVIFERNFLEAGASAATGIQVVNGFTARNNIARSTYEIIHEVLYSAGIGNSPVPEQGFWYNNSAYRPTNGFGAWGAIVSLPNTVTGQVFTNNVGYAPFNASTTFVGGSGVLGVNYTLNNNSTDTQVRTVLPFTAAVPAVAADFAPANYAVNGGTWVPVYKNYFGTTNAAPREIGAI